MLAAFLWVVVGAVIGWFIRKLWISRNFDFDGLAGRLGIVAGLAGKEAEKEAERVVAFVRTEVKKL